MGKEKTPDKAGKKKKKSGVVTRFLVISLVVILILLGGLAGFAYWAGSKALTSAPLQPQIIAFTSDDVMTAFRKIQPIGPAVMQSHPDQVTQLTLTTPETNALLGLVNNSGVLASVSGVSLNLPRNLMFRMENNCFWFTFSRTVNFDNPFGKYINCEVAVEPQIHGGKINYRVVVCRVGQLNVPPFFLQKYVDWEVLNNSEPVEMAKKALIDFYVDGNGRLQLKFYPFQLRQLLLNYMKNGRAKAGA